MLKLFIFSILIVQFIQFQCFTIPRFASYPTIKLFAEKKNIFSKFIPVLAEDDDFDDDDDEVSILNDKNKNMKNE